MMLKPRNHKLFFVIFFVITQMNNLYSQNMVIIEKQINTCFTQLQNINVKKPSNAILKFYPIYEPYIYQKIINEEKNKSGALCKEYLVSEKLSLLQNIYMLYTNDETNSLYNLIDSNEKKIYDILRYNCSPKEIGKVDTINQNAVNDLVKSYYKWYQIMKEKGFEKTLKENISPTSYTKYKWVKELGYLSEKKTNSEILEKYFQIKKDSSYLSYFITSQDLSRFYKGKTSTAIINEIIILSLVNNQTSFTTNILNFKLQGKETDIFEIIKQLENHKDCNQLLQQLKEKNISITLKI